MKEYSIYYRQDGRWETRMPQQARMKTAKENTDLLVQIKIRINYF